MGLHRRRFLIDGESYGSIILRIGISCSEDNIGSRKIIEANGGLLLRRCEPGWFYPKPYFLFEVMLI